MTTKLPFLLGAVMIVVTLSACRSRYEIVLANTAIVDAYSKPKLTNGFYYYKDAKGEMQALFYGRVREINRQ